MPTTTSTSTLAVHLLRVNEAFPAPNSDTALNDHSLDTLIDLVDPESRVDVRKFRFLRDARRASSFTAFISAALTLSASQDASVDDYLPFTSRRPGSTSLGPR